MFESETEVLNFPTKKSAFAMHQRNNLKYFENRNDKQMSEDNTMHLTVRDLVPFHLQRNVNGRL